MKLQGKRRLDAVLGGLGVLLLRPVLTLAGSIVRRDHDPAPRGPIGVIKILGGGSLVLAAPSLLGLKRRYPDHPLLLVTSKALVPFAGALGVFDELVVIDDTSFSSMVHTGLRAVWRLRRVDTLVDLEPHSRLSKVLGALSTARNRIAFFLESPFWRKNLATHLVYFNRAGHVSIHYEAAMSCMGVEPVPRTVVADHVARTLGLESPADQAIERAARCLAPHRVCVAPGCSDLSRERMLTPAQWIRGLTACLPAGATEVALVGAAQDAAVAQDIIALGRAGLPFLNWVNLADGRSLAESLNVVGHAGWFLGIDSGLLHFARLLGVPSRSFWGPTNPGTLLPGPGTSWDRSYYMPVVCSPCIHVAKVPPCNGRNVCMEAAVRAAEDIADAQVFAAQAPVPTHLRH